MTPLAALNRLSFYTLLEVLRLLPLQGAMRCLDRMGRAKFALLHRRRQNLIQWNRQIAPDRSDAEILELAQRQSVSIEYRQYLNYLLLLHDARANAAMVERRGWERIGQALEGGRGVVLLSTHIGFSRLLRWVLRTTDYRVLYLLRIGFAAPADNALGARFQRWHYRRYRQDDDNLAGNEGLSVLYMKKGYDHLRGNGVVNIAGDGRSGRRRLAVDTCGHRQSVGLGGISLGLLAGAPVLPCFTSMLPDGRFCLEIQEALRVPGLGNRERQSQAMGLDYAARIEDHIRRHPDSVTWPRYWVAQRR